MKTATALQSHIDSQLSRGPFGVTQSLRQACADVCAAYLEFADASHAFVPELRERINALSGRAYYDSLLHPPLRYLARKLMQATVYENKHYAIAEASAEDYLPHGSDQLCAFSHSSNINGLANNGLTHLSNQDHPNSALTLPVLNPQRTPHDARLISELYQNEIAVDDGPQVDMIPAQTSIQNAIQHGLYILNQVLKTTAQSCLQHVSLCMVYSVNGLQIAAEARNTGAIDSVSSPAIPGAIFLYCGGLEEPWRAAEWILHEAVHCKLYDFYTALEILKPGYDSRQSATILSPWNEGLARRHHQWPFDQALGAYHVYVHLFAFYLSALQHDYEPHTQDYLESKLAHSRQRAQILETQLKRHIKTHLAEQGIAFFTWLLSCRKTMEQSATAMENQLSVV